MKIKIQILISALLFFSIAVFSQTGTGTSTGLKSGKASMSVYANDDFARVNEDDSVSAYVLNNDNGLSDGVGSLTVISGPEHGTVRINADNSILYIPEKSFNGHDSLMYRICDTYGDCDTAKVKLEVVDVNYIPVTENDTVVYIHNSQITIDIINNDNINGDFPFSILITRDVNNGSCYIDENNMVVPSFDRSFIGTDSLEYTLCDADGDCSDAKVIFIVKSEEGGEIYIPNGFSPNGDGINDIFRVPDFGNFTNVNARIITETGQIVFEENPYQNNWNGVANTGSMKGNPVPAGTYYYIFNTEGVNEPITGFVYLIR